jgi:biotin operon repressor
MTGERLHLFALSVVDFLEERRHQERPPLKGSELGAHFGVSERVIREAVESARRGGFLIGSGDDGYFFAMGEEEMQPVLAHLRSRALAILRTRSAIRRELRRRLLREIQLELADVRPGEQLQLRV